MTYEESPEFWSDRGIGPAVRDGRPYVRWSKDDSSTVRRAYAGLNAGQLSFMARIARQSDGWIITRHAPRGLDVPPIYPEVRPDKPVHTEQGPTHHFHGDLAKAAEQGYQPHLVFSPEVMAGHIARSKAEDDHHGVNVDEPHDHWGFAKYVFPPGAKKKITYLHDHEAMLYPERRRHASRAHGGKVVEGPHEHTSSVPDKDDPGVARRIDVHPFGIERLETADVVYFAIEGCLKADAILSAGGAVFSVPSVSLWAADELERFARRYLQGKLVAIVPDADWAKEPSIPIQGHRYGNGNQVIVQALLCQTALRRYGVADAVVAAPPLAAGHKGVDDFLGAGRGKLSDLEVLQRRPKMDAIEDFVVRHGRRVDQIGRNRAVLSFLATHADQQGRISLSLRSMGKALDGKHHNKVLDAVTDLAAGGAIEVDRDFTVSQGRYSSQEDFELRPTITVEPEFRAIELPPVALGHLADAA